MGYIDTTQLHLRKAQLLSGKAVAESKRHNIPEQVASLRQQIASQRSELVRFTQLLEEGAATAKQVDDLKAQIAVLERQLSAQTTNLQSGNRAVAGESSSLDAQIMQLEDQIANSIIASPITGTVLAQYAEEGELATAGLDVLCLRSLTLRRCTCVPILRQTNSRMSRSVSRCVSMLTMVSPIAGSTRA